MSKDGGPAFPVEADMSAQGRARLPAFPGMSLRDWFAGQALAGLCANPGGPFQANGQSGWAIVNCTNDDVAHTAYALADAFIAAREAP